MPAKVKFYDRNIRTGVLTLVGQSFGGMMKVCGLLGSLGGPYDDQVVRNRATHSLKGTVPMDFVKLISPHVEIEAWSSNIAPHTKTAIA
jgi:hypothetical protein